MDSCLMTAPAASRSSVSGPETGPGGPSASRRKRIAVILAALLGLGLAWAAWPVRAPSYALLSCLPDGWRVGVELRDAPSLIRWAREEGLPHRVAATPLGRTLAPVVFPRARTKGMTEEAAAAGALAECLRRFLAAASERLAEPAGTGLVGHVLGGSIAMGVFDADARDVGAIVVPGNGARLYLWWKRRMDGVQLPDGGYAWAVDMPDRRSPARVDGRMPSRWWVTTHRGLALAATRPERLASMRAALERPETLRSGEAWRFAFGERGVAMAVRRSDYPATPVAAPPPPGPEAKPAGAGEGLGELVPAPWPLGTETDGEPLVPVLPLPGLPEGEAFPGEASGVEGWLERLDGTLAAGGLRETVVWLAPGRERLAFEGFVVGDGDPTGAGGVRNDAETPPLLALSWPDGVERMAVSWWGDLETVRARLLRDAAAAETLRLPEPVMPPGEVALREWLDRGIGAFSDGRYLAAVAPLPSTADADAGARPWRCPVVYWAWGTRDATATASGFSHGARRWAALMAAPGGSALERLFRDGVAVETLREGPPPVERLRLPPLPYGGLDLAWTVPPVTPEGESGKRGGVGVLATPPPALTFPGEERRDAKERRPDGLWLEARWEWFGEAGLAAMAGDTAEELVVRRGWRPESWSVAEAEFAVRAWRAGWETFPSGKGRVAAWDEAGGWRARLRGEIKVAP